MFQENGTKEMIRQCTLVLLVTFLRLYAQGYNMQLAHCNDDYLLNNAAAAAADDDGDNIDPSQSLQQIINDPFDVDGLIPRLKSLANSQ